MSKKKIFVAALLACINASSALAMINEAGVSSVEKNMYIEGNAAGYDFITFAVKDKAGEILYIRELDVCEDGTYSAKFRYNGTVGNGEKLYVNYGGEDMLHTVEVAETQTLVEVDEIDFQGINGTDIPSKGDWAKAVASIKNKYSDSGEADIYFACYNEQGGLIDLVKTDVKYGYDTLSQTESDFCKIPEDTAKIKAFLWEKHNMSPISKEHSRDIANIIDTENPTKVAVVGDSTVHINGYLQLLEYVYDLKYPNNQITFINKGIGGDTALGMVSRFDWDIINDKVTGKPDTVIFGTGYNETFWVYTPGSANNTEYMHDYAYNSEWQNPTKEFADLCNQKDIDAMLRVYFTYDDDTNNSALSDSNILPGYRDMQSRFVSGGKAIAEEKGIYFADLYSYIREYSDKFINENPNYNETVFTLGDRTHQSDAGKLLDAVMIAKYNGVSNCVSEVSIDVNGEETANNADIEVLERTNNSIRYKYSPKSLPMYATNAYNKLKQTLGVNVTDMINREIIKIENLEEGSYTVSMDDAVIGTYTASELSKGVNIAENPANPGAVISKQLYEKLMTISHQGFRNIAAISHILTKQFDLDVNDIDAVRTFVNEHPDGINYSGTYQYTAEELQSYLENKETEEEQYAEILKIQEEAREIAKSGLKTYVVEVTMN